VCEDGCGLPRYVLTNGHTRQLRVFLFYFLALQSFFSFCFGNECTKTISSSNRKDHLPLVYFLLLLLSSTSFPPSSCNPTHAYEDAAYSHHQSIEPSALHQASNPLPPLAPHQRLGSHYLRTCELPVKHRDTTLLPTTRKRQIGRNRKEFREPGMRSD